MQTIRFKTTPKQILLLSLVLYCIGSILVYLGIDAGSLLCAIAIALPVFFAVKYLLDYPGSLFWVVIGSVLGLALIGCLAWSATMYAGFFASLAPASADYTPQGFDWFLSGLPFIGWAFRSTGWLFNQIAMATQGSLLGILGVIVFLANQTAEVIPVLLCDCLPFRKAVIRTAGKFSNLAAPKNSPSYVNQWTRDYNESPRRILRNFRYASYVAYAIDTAVCALAAPVIGGGYANWANVRYTFDAGHVDWPNVLLNAITIIGFTLAAKASVSVYNALFIVFESEK